MTNALKALEHICKLEAILLNDGVTPSWCMLNNRVTLRENPNAFIRCNDKVGSGFEVYIQHGKV